MLIPPFRPLQHKHEQYRLSAFKLCITTCSLPVHQMALFATLGHEISHDSSSPMRYSRLFSSCHRLVCPPTHRQRSPGMRVEACCRRSVWIQQVWMREAVWWKRCWVQPRATGSGAKVRLFRRDVSSWAALVDDHGSGDRCGGGPGGQWRCRRFRQHPQQGLGWVAAAEILVCNKAHSQTVSHGPQSRDANKQRGKPASLLIHSEKTNKNH